MTENRDGFPARPAGARSRVDGRLSFCFVRLCVSEERFVTSGQNAPRGAGVKPEENRFDEQAIVRRRTAHMAFATRQNILDPIPLVVAMHNVASISPSSGRPLASQTFADSGIPRVSETPNVLHPIPIHSPQLKTGPKIELSIVPDCLITASPEHRASVGESAQKTSLDRSIELSESRAISHRPRHMGRLSEHLRKPRPETGGIP